MPFVPRLPGDVVVLRHIRDDYVWAVAARVVHDREEAVALYVQPGNGMIRMGDPDGRPTRDFVNATTPVPTTWIEHHALHLIRFGDRHATQLYWTETGWDFRCWYINFQEPLRRVDVGFESMDLTLDLVVAPDFDTWFWKDEDEFEHGIKGGWYTSELLTDLRAYGERVLDDVRSRRPPFDHPWHLWRPDPSWTPITLPPNALSR